MAKREDLDDFQRRATVAKKNMSQKMTFTLPEGVTTFRILNTPPDEDRNSPRVYIEYYMHYNIGPKKLRQRCGLDPLDDSGDCWGCRQIEKERKNGNTAAAKEMEKKKVFEVQAAIFDSDLGGLRGPVRWPTTGTSSKSLGYMLLTICANKNAKRYLDHEKGRNFSIERNGMKMTDTTYTSPIPDDEPSAVPVEIVRKLKPFADVVPAYDESAFKKAYYGQDEEDEDETPTVGKRRKPVVLDDDDEVEEVKPKKRPAIVEDEDEDVEEDEEEEPRPKPKKRPVVVEEDEEEEPAPKPKKKVVVEDEDEDEDLQFGDEEDDPDTKPKKKPVIIEEEDEDDNDEPAPKPKKTAKKVVEEDEDLALEEDEEEEEDDPPVKPKKKPTRVVEEDEEEEEEEVESPRPRRR